MSSSPRLGLKKSAKPAARATLLAWWLGYVAFVIYGSLVPLDYRPIPLDKAWTIFRQIHLLDVGAGGRADWVANGVLYVPVGFLTASLLAGRERTHLPLLAAVGAVLFGTMLAVAVEFAQLAFPPRTVSVNDVLAEFIGSVLGMGLAGVAADRFSSLLAALAGTGDRLVSRLLKAYALAYCAFSLFPYDLILSGGELADKLHSDNWGWLWAGSSRGGAAAALAKLASEVLAALPLGWLAAARGREPVQVTGVGLALGAAIEFAQFFLVSGVAQGISVLTRALGLWTGAMAWQRRARLDPLRLAASVRRFGLPLVGLYALSLMAVTGWFELPWQGLGAAVEALKEVRFLPFYYHYYTTEQAALLSLTSVCLMYAPLGVAAWACFLGARVAAGLGVVVALGIEASKLFLLGLHPDPTNIMLAGLAAWGVCKLVNVMERMVTGARVPNDLKSAMPASVTVANEAVSMGAAPMQDTGTSPGGASNLRQTVSAVEGFADEAMAPPGPLSLPLRTPRGLPLFGLALAVVLAFWEVVRFPFEPVLLGLGLAAYVALLWFRPQDLWVAVPSALALLDLAPWSGRFFIDEFDLLLLVSLGVGYARVPPASRGPDRALKFALILVGVSYGVAALRGLLPWQMPDANTFNNYYSSFNALRVGKGALWAFLLYGLWGRFAGAGVDVGRLFAWGMVIGLAGTVAVVLWERAVFPGLLDFASVYRVTGPFSQMHTGGADIECYLTVATPFLVMLLMEQQAWPERVVGLILLAGTAYAIMVTFSRAGYAGFAVALVVALAPRLWSTSGSSGTPWLRRGAMAAALVVAALTVMLPILKGSFAQERIARTGEDLLAREAHWREALAMRDPGLATQLFGMGLGRFPQTHYWRSKEPRAAGYGLGREGGGYFLRLGSGSPLYVEQFVDVQPNRDYVLSLKFRSSQGAGRLTASLCEKWLLTSARCAAQTFDVPAGQDWQVLRVTLATGEVGSSPWYAARPVKFSINNSSSGAVVDVDQVELNARDGTELLANGGFAEGLDRWFFSADVDLPWHIWSLPVAVLFEMGWLGLLAFGVFLAVGLSRAAWRVRASDSLAGAAVAGGAGLTLIGLLDSIVDSPRMLFTLLLLVGFYDHRAPPP